MRRYRTLSRATRDARAEANPSPVNLFVPTRDPSSLCLVVDGQVFEAEGTPARRCNQFWWTLNGEPIGCGGLEHAWRAIQRKRVPLLGERNLM